MKNKQVVFWSILNSIATITIDNPLVNVMDAIDSCSR
jgi:hypothetical protein